MPSLDTLITFFGVALLLGFTPGPDNVFVLVQAVALGRRAAMRVVAGLCTGLVVHTTLVATGMAAVFSTSVLAFAALKWAGAAYLAWLAWQAWRAGAGAAPAGAPEVVPSGGRLYLRGVAMNLGNPKIVLFFLAFLPQFVDAGRGSVALQLGVLGLVFIAATVLSFGSIALLAGPLGRWLQTSARAQQRLHRVTALVFAALAARLALVSR